MGELHPNAQTVLRGFQAFAEGDLATMKSLMAADAVWHSAGRSKWSGDFTGPDTIVRFMGDVAADADSIVNVPHAVLADDDHVVVLVNATITRGGQATELNNVFVFHVGNGQIQEAWLTSIDQYAADAVWSD